jgi:hypothetical protein
VVANTRMGNIGIFHECGDFPRGEQKERRSPHRENSFHIHTHKNKKQYLAFSQNSPPSVPPDDLLQSFDAMVLKLVGTKPLHRHLPTVQALARPSWRGSNYFMLEDGSNTTAPLTIGDLLEEIANRQQSSIPAEDQLQLAEATINAMLDRGSADLADTFDELSSDLFGLEQNVSSALLGLGENVTSSAEARLQRLPASEALPGRASVRATLAEFRAAEAKLAREREQAAAGSFRARRKPDGWWRDKLAAGGSAVSTLELSASALGFLLFIGAINLFGGFAGITFGGTARDTMGTAWQGCFAFTCMLYLFALLRVVYSDREV